MGCWLAEEEFEELLFDGGLEAADECSGVGAQGAGKVVALEDEVAGAVDGAEEGDRCTVEEGGGRRSGRRAGRRRGQRNGVGLGGCRARRVDSV